MTIRLEQLDQLALLTLDRPAQLNALSFELLHKFSDALEQVADWPVRALLITGAGPKAFCAGADIGELIGRSMADQLRDTRFGQQLFVKLERLPIPSIALINGYAFGGGLELAMACTFRLGSRTASMALPEIKLGLIPGYGGTQRLPRLVGEGRALDLILTGRRINAEEAQRIGLIHQVVDGDIVEAGRTFAKNFSDYSLRALEFARAAVLRACDTPLSQGLDVEAELSTLAYQTKDAAEGMAAFLAKRPAEFKDE